MFAVHSDYIPHEELVHVHSTSSFLKQLPFSSFLPSTFRSPPISRKICRLHPVIHPLFFCLNCLYLGFLIWEKLYNIYACVFDLFHVTLWSQVASGFLQMTQVNPSLWQNSTLLCAGPTFSVSILDAHPFIWYPFLRRENRLTGMKVFVWGRVWKCLE